MTQYSNFTTSLEKVGLKLIVSSQDYYKNKIVIFQCTFNHVTKLSCDSFKNKQIRCNNDPIQLCTQCFKNNNNINRFNLAYKQILERKGHHILLTIEPERRVTYRCGVCGSMNKSSLRNLLYDNKGNCPTCQNWQFKNDEDDVRKTLAEFGYTLVKYDDCHTVTIKCDKGHVYTGSLSAFKTRERRCPECAPFHRTETNLKVYKVENVFQSEEIKAKIIETCIKKRGVTHHMKLPEIFSKSVRSSFSRKEYIFPSGKTAMIMGYEPQCITTLLETYPEEDIIVDTMIIPVILYLKLKKRSNGEEFEEMGSYYPDISLPDKLIEVKSIYTYNRDLVNNERKFNECAKQGYVLELWIYRNKTTLDEIRVYKKDKDCNISITTTYKNIPC